MPVTELRRCIVEPRAYLAFSRLITGIYQKAIKSRAKEFIKKIIEELIKKITEINFLLVKRERETEGERERGRKRGLLDVIDRRNDFSESVSF